MPHLGNRSSVMGPQPIAERFAVPAAMLEAAEHILDLLAAGRRAELEALVVSKAIRELRELMDAITPGAYERREIVAHAKLNNHYYIKARLFGPAAAPMTLQLRLGEHDGHWAVWEAVNLSGGRTAWTR